MKRLINSIRRLTRSKAEKQIDDLHEQSRAEGMQAIAGGKGRELLEERAKLLGLSTDSKKRPKMKFGKH